MVSLSSATLCPQPTASGRQWQPLEALDSLILGHVPANESFAGPGPRFAPGSLFCAIQRIGFCERADADPRTAHCAGRLAGGDYVAHSFPSHHRGAALPPAGLEHPGNALQSGSDWSGPLLDVADHAASGNGHVSPGMGAARGRTGHLATGLERWFAAVENLLVALCPRKRHSPVSGYLPYSGAA